VLYLVNTIVCVLHLVLITDEATGITVIKITVDSEADLGIVIVGELTV